MAFIIGSLWDQERLTTVRQSGGHLDGDLSGSLARERQDEVQNRLTEEILKDFRAYLHYNVFVNSVGEDGGYTDPPESHWKYSDQWEEASASNSNTT